MHNTKCVVSLFGTFIVFIVAGLVFTPISLHPVFAAAPAYCFEHDCPSRTCDNNIKGGTASCCWEDFGERKCQTCHVDTNTGEFYDCTSLNPTTQGGPPSGVIAPPPSGVAPPPSTTTCPENTALDANGNCAPVTQAPPSTDQGTATIQPSPPDDNKPLKHKLPKGNILGELPQSEKQFTAKKKNNKDDSPTPPPCPTDNSPIPPDCTLKPKF
jgi:hypothetical protein